MAGKNTVQVPYDTIFLTAAQGGSMQGPGRSCGVAWDWMKKARLDMRTIRWIPHAEPHLNPSELLVHHNSNGRDRVTESGVPSIGTCCSQGGFHRAVNLIYHSRLLLLSKLSQPLLLPISNAHPFSISLLTSNTHSFSNFLLCIGGSTQNRIFQIARNCLH